MLAYAFHGRRWGFRVLATVWVKSSTNWTLHVPLDFASHENGRCLSICKEESENGKKTIINNNHNNDNNYQTTHNLNSTVDLLLQLCETLWCFTGKSIFFFTKTYPPVGLSKQTGDPRSHGEEGPFEVGHWHPTAWLLRWRDLTRKETTIFTRLFHQWLVSLSNKYPPGN